MKRILFIITLLAFLGFSSIATAQSINNCIRTNGSHGHIAIAGLSLDTSDFTVELWIKIDTAVYQGTGPAFNDPSIFGNKDWSSGANTGLELAIYTGGVYKVNFTPAGISRFDQVSSGPFLEDRWNHIAVSFQRNGYLRMYTNGILTDSLNISSGHGHTIDQTLPYNLLDDGTGSYTYASFKGYADEFRIWKGVRTAAQIRQYMCRKLPSGTPNLLVYFQMDQTTGTSVPDVSGSGHIGTLTNLTSSAWVSSNAAVGDTSNYLYGSSFAGDSVMVSSSNHGIFMANNIASGIQGIQVYRTNFPPASNTGITSPGAADSIYFGVYPVSETSAYEVKYNYNGFPAAAYNASTVQLFDQPNVANSWATFTSTNTVATKTLQSVVATNYQHFILGSMPLVPSEVSNLATGKNNISIYPNPVTGGALNFTSANNELLTMDLVNLHGRLMRSVSIDKWPYSMDVSCLEAGNYIVHCYNNNTTESFKIIITR